MPNWAFGPWTYRYEEQSWPSRNLTLREMNLSTACGEDSLTLYGVFLTPYDFSPPPSHFVIQTQRHLPQMSLQLMAHPMLGSAFPRVFPLPQLQETWTYSFQAAQTSGCLKQNGEKETLSIWYNMLVSVWIWKQRGCSALLRSHLVWDVCREMEEMWYTIQEDQKEMRKV